MAGTATTLTGTRDLIAAVLGEIAGILIYKDGGVLLDSLPAVEIKLPRLLRVPVDEPENELGSFTWDTEWPLRLYVSADEIGNDAALRYLALIVAKFDERETLGATGFNTLVRLVEAEPAEDAPADAKPTSGYAMTLHVRQLI